MSTSDSSAGRQYIVEGMTCSHCVASVREEVSLVAGVQSVDVELASGRLLVNGDGFSDDVVKASVEDAGYDLRT